MVDGFTTTHVISAYHQYSCEFESRSWRRVLDTALCDKVCQCLATGWRYSLGIQLCPTNKNDSHGINVESDVKPYNR